MTKDYLVHATAAPNAMGEPQIRAFAATTKLITETARQAHDTSPVVTAALGRLMTGGVLMGSMLKNDSDLTTLQISGDGPVKGLVVTADNAGHVKGYAKVPSAIKPANAMHKLDVGGIVGRGTLQVISDLGLKDPYIGTVDLQTGEIGDDLAWYFASSEQVPSAVGVGVLMNKDNTVRCSGGFIIQLMPFAEESVIAKLEENISKMPQVTALLDTGMTPEQLLQMVMPDMQVEITRTMPCSFSCNCDRERVEKVLLSIGKDELTQMIDEGEDIEIRCQFCNKPYTFTPEQMKELLA